MRSEHIIIIVCLLLIWKLATRTTGAANTTPPDEPKTSERPAEHAATEYVLLPKVS